MNQAIFSFVFLIGLADKTIEYILCHGKKTDVHKIERTKPSDEFHVGMFTLKNVVISDICQFHDRIKKTAHANQNLKQINKDNEFV